MFAGVHFGSLLDTDNFTLRRTTGHNMVDPESLISGAEIARGMTYRNSKRLWLDEEHYHRAVTGALTTDDILQSAPRVLLYPPQPVVEMWRC